MRRCLALLIATVIPLVLAGEAAGKVALKQAKVCSSASRCATQTSSAGELPLELFGPTAQIGRRAPEPARSNAPHYRVRLTTQPVRGSDVIKLDFFPGTGFIHVLGRPGSVAGGVTLNTGWVPLKPIELHAYRSLASEADVGPPRKRPESPTPPGRRFSSEALSGFVAGLWGL